MERVASFRSLIVLLFFGMTIIYSCSKGGGGGGTTPTDPCAGVTVTVSGTVTNPGTPTSSDGSIAITATGGSGFTFNINGGIFQASGNFANLAAGSYTIVAKNSSGCTGSASFTVTVPNPCAGVTIVVSGTVVNPTAPAATNGSITAAATGSTGFTFNINGGAFQANGNFTNLAAGSYTIVGKNSNGCTGSASFTLTAPNPCAGVTILVSGTVVNPTAPAATNGSITATASGSTGFTFNINGAAFQANGNFTNLAAGSYTVVAKDVNGCTGTTSFTLTAPNPCAGVTITLSNSIVNNIDRKSVV